MIPENPILPIRIKGVCATDQVCGDNTRFTKMCLRSMVTKKKRFPLTLDFDSTRIIGEIDSIKYDKDKGLIATGILEEIPDSHKDSLFYLAIAVEIDDVQEFPVPKIRVVKKCTLFEVALTNNPADPGTTPIEWLT